MEGIRVQMNTKINRVLAFSNNNPKIEIIITFIMPLKPKEGERVS
jgi:hypothetical protein